MGNIPCGSNATPSHRRLAASALLLAITLAGMLWWSWAKWPDGIVDFGRELYIPWRLNEGDVLYRDIAYFHGPLSPYFNACWFSLLGPGLWVLAGVNVVLLVITLALVFYLVVRLADVVAATVAGMIFLLVFAVGQYERCGNFNWICPYSHETTHSVTLSLLAIVLLDRYLIVGPKCMALLPGLVVGCVFLTRCEVFLALAIASAAGWAASSLRVPARQCVGALLWFLLGMCLPPTMAYVLLSQSMSPTAALHGVLGSWPHILNSELTNNPYYRSLRGTDDIATSVKGMLWGTMACLLVIGIAIAIGRWFNRREWGRWWLLGAIFAVISLTIGRLATPVWPLFLRPWPLLMAIIAVQSAWRLWVSCNQSERIGVEHEGPCASRIAPPERNAVLRLIVSLFSLGLLARVMLNTQVFHYGFALAMPATMLAIAAAWTWIPDGLTALKWEQNTAAYRASILGVGAAAAVWFVGLAHPWYRDKVVPVAEGRDYFLADERGRNLVAAGREIVAVASPDDTLAVLPEGVMLNYLHRMRNPTPYINFMPPEVITFGEETMLASLARNPPNWVVLTQRDTAEYGFKGFGQDFAPRLFQWIDAEYQVVAVLPGSQPVSTVIVGQRKSSQATPRTAP